MKTKTLMKGLKLIIISCLFLPVFKVNAQNIVLTEIRPSAMTVCMGDYPFTVKIRNNSAETVTNFRLKLDLPDYINYTGNLNNAAEFNTANRNEPVFSLPDLAGHDSLTISYSAEASCGIIATISNDLTVQNKYTCTYALGGNASVLGPVSCQSYNLLFANLSMTVSNPINTVLRYGERVNQNSPAFRTIQVVNSGNGALDTLILKITPEGEIAYNAFVSEAHPETTYPFTTLGNELTVILSGEALKKAILQGNNDNLFNPGETIRLIEDFTVVNCSGNNSLYKVEWGCYQDACNTNSGNATTNSNIGVHSGDAQFDLFLGDVSAIVDYCEDNEMEFYFVNTGSQPGDFARDLKIDILSYEQREIYILPESFELYDFQVNGQLISNSLISSSSAINWYFPVNTTTTPGYRVNFTGNTVAGMLEDLDGDGFFDDLAAGDTLKLIVKVRFTDFTELEAECPLNVLQNYGMPQISWLTSCGEPRTSIDGNNYYKNRYYVYNYPDQQTMTDLITEPVDFVEGQPETFRFCTGSWYYNWTLMDCPVNGYQGVINLPAGFHLNDSRVTWYSAAGDSIQLYAEESGSAIIVDSIGKSNLQQDNWMGCFNVELILICPQDIAIQTPSLIGWEMQYKCSDCDVIQRRACSSEQVYVHVTTCPGPENGCPGIYSSGFDMKRTTLGWTDATRQVHVSDTAAGLRLNAGYALDQVESRTYGQVTGENLQTVFAEIVYTAPNQVFNFDNGHFEVYRNGQQVFNCAATAPVIVVVENVYINRFEMPCQSSLLPDDQVVFVAYWTIANTPFMNKNREYEIPDFRSRFLAMTADEGLTGCDSWGARFTLLSINTYPLATLGTVPASCNNLQVKLNWINMGGSKGNDFPNEFRNLGKLGNRISFSIPAGYSYVSGSAQMFAYSPNEISSSPKYFTDNVTAITPVFSANGDSLIFNENWPLVDKAGNDHVSYSTPPVLTFEIRPDCEHEDTVYALMDFTYTNNQYLVNTALHQQIGWEDTWNDAGNPATNMRWYHYLPNLSVNTGLATVDAYENTVSWDLQICNLKDATHNTITAAEGVWVDLDNLASNADNILITHVEQVGSTNIPMMHTYNGDNSAFVEIGSLGVNACRSYKVHARYQNCSADQLDSLRVLTGWNCGAYPSPEDAEISACHVDTNFFMIRYKTANLQMSVSEPFGMYENCDTLNYEVKLTSSEPANMYAIQFWANLPEGAHIVNAYYQYPQNNSAWISIDAGASNAFSGYNPHGWDLSALVPQFSNGFLGSRFPQQNEIRVRFEITMDCMYNGDQELMLFARGVTNCNDSLALNAHYNLPVNAPVWGEYRIEQTAQDTLSCQGANTISFSVKNMERAFNNAGDSVRVELPEGFHFVAGNSTPSEPVVNGNQLTWAVGTLLSGQEIQFSFQVEAGQLSGCHEIALPLTIIRTVNTSCLQGCRVSETKDDLRAVYCCNPCAGSAEFRWNTACQGSETCFIPERSALTGYTASWNFGDGSTSTVPGACHLYAKEGVYQVTHIITNPEGCSDTVIYAVTVLPAPVMRLFGQNYLCEGGSQILKVNVATPTVWSLDGAVIASGPHVTASQSGTYTVTTTASNGCTATASIAVQVRVINPVISASAMSMCVGYNITLSTGSNADFAYQWQKLVGGIWIDLVGNGPAISTPVYKNGQNTYRVIVRDRLSGCEEMNTINIFGATQNCKQILISPNPTNKQQTAIWHTFENGENAAHVEIYSMQGEMIMKQQVDVRSEKTDLDFSGRAEGIYLVRLIVDGQEVALEKIMVLNR